jgi:CRP-like cAMP-binding protein
MSGISRRLARTLEREIHVPDGEIIVQEGQEGDEMFLVRSGAVEIFHTRNGQKVVAARLGRGEFFGEMSVLESLPRDASARAVGPTVLLVLGPGALLLRLRQDPSLAVEMLHALSGRIRALNARIGEL